MIGESSACIYNYFYSPSPLFLCAMFFQDVESHDILLLFLLFFSAFVFLVHALLSSSTKSPSILSIASLPLLFFPSVEEKIPHASF